MKNILRDFYIPHDAPEVFAKNMEHKIAVDIGKVVMKDFAKISGSDHMFVRRRVDIMVIDKKEMQQKLGPALYKMLVKAMKAK